MAQVITLAGEKLFATKAQANQQLDIDTFIFANVAGQDPAAEIDRNEGIPTSVIVHQQNVQQTGRINDNVVVYSTVLDSVTGPFEFNWVGLYSSVNQTLVAISHVPTVSKTITAPGSAGNTLNRNFGIEYSGIADLAGISVSPETWQLDFSARLSGMDELTRNLAKDLNGKDSFIDDGFKVVLRSTANTFSVLPGVGYVNGLRVELLDEEILIANSYPKNVYVDAYFDGNASSKWKSKHTLRITGGKLENYIDETGKQHYLVKIAEVTAADEIVDLRVTFNRLKDSYKQTFNTMNGLLNNKESFKIGKNVETSSFGNIFDSGGGKFRFTGVVNLEQSGNIDIIGGDVYDSIGQQFKVIPTNGRVTSASMGLIPDGVTDYHADGRMDKWLRYLSATDVTGVFIAGIYNTTMDNYYSNVSIHGEKGAIFTSGFHVAVNRDLNNPTLDRNKNTTWTGECASYERVGTWNCDNAYIERIIIREDAAKSKSGLRGAGVHLFGGTEDMTVGSIYVENSERSAALAVDWEPGQTPPKNVHLGNVVIKSSYVHGVSLVGENVTWDSMVIEEYGMGELTDPNINFAISQNPGGLVQAMGFSLGSFGSYSGNSVIVEQNPESPQGVGSAVNLFTNGTFKCGLVKVNGSLGIGFQNNFTDATIDKLVIENSATQGVFNKAKISGSSLVVSGSGTRGIRNEQGGLLAFNEVRTRGNGEEGYDSSAGIAAINRLQCLNNNQSTGGFGCVIGSQSRGNISALEIEQPSSGIGGGVDFNGVLNKFAVGNIIAKNASSSAGTGFASISLKANGLTHYGGGELSGDNGASSFQPLRIVGALNSSLNGLNISNEFNGQIVAGTISATDNIGFMNCTNAAGTNISSVTVSEFNCSGMTG